MSCSPMFHLQNEQPGFLFPNYHYYPFDFNIIIKKALHRVRGKLKYKPIVFELLPEIFLLRQLQDLYENILQIPITSI